MALQKKKKKYGIILVTTLFFITIIIMLCVTMAQSGKNTLAGGMAYSNNEQAYMAAMSGVIFAQGELYRNKNFGAGGDTDAVSKPDDDNKRSDDIIIERAQNRVTGFLDCEQDDTSTARSKFDIVFYGTNINSDNLPTENRWLSVNNLTGTTTIPPDTITENGDQPISSSFEAASRFRHTAPAGSFYIVSKGTCGKSVRYVESILTSEGPSVLSGGTTINGNNSAKGISIKGCSNVEYTEENPLLSIKNIDDSASGRITTKYKFSINDSGAADAMEEIIGGSNEIILSSETLSVANVSAPTEKEGFIHNTSPIINTDDLGSISDFDTAAAEYAEGVAIPSGTYVFLREIQENASETMSTISKGTWKYIEGDIVEYDTTFGTNGDKITADVVIDEAAVLSLESAQTVTDLFRGNSESDKISEALSFGSDGAQTRTVSVKGKVSSSGFLNFAVIDKITDASGGTVYRQSDRSSVDFSVKDNGSLTTNSTGANLFIGGEVTGSGKIFSNGNLAFNAGSAFETAPQTGVALWAKNDIVINEAENVSSTSLTSAEMILSEGKISLENSGQTISQDGSYLSVAGTDMLYSEIGNNIIEGGQAYEITDKNNNKYTIVTHKYEGDQALTIFKNDELIKTFTRDEIRDELTYYDGLITNKTRQLNLLSRDMYYDNGDVSINFHDHFCSDYKTYSGDMKLLINGECIGTVDVASHASSYTRSIGEKGLYFSLNDRRGQNICSTEHFTPGENITQNFTYPDLSDIITPDIQINMGSTSLSAEEYVWQYYKNKVGNTFLKGTVYSADGSIFVSTGGRLFNVRGALITYNGNLTIDNISTSTLLYDPDYVPFFGDLGILTKSQFMSSF